MVKRVLKTVFAVIFLMVFGTCSSPDNGEGVLSLSFAPNPESRYLVDTGTELSNMVYAVTFTRQGETVTKEFSGSSANISLAAGKWTVSIRAIGNTPAIYNTKYKDEDDYLPAVLFPNRMLRGMSDEVEVEIKTGKKTDQTIKMVTATEVTSYYQAMRATMCVNDSGKEEILLISENMKFDFNDPYTNDEGDTVSDHGANISYTKNIRIIADKPITLSRGKNCDMPLLRVDGTLTLGGYGMKGSLTFDGSYTAAPETDTIFYVAPGGTLTMNDRVTLTGNNTDSSGSGVRVLEGTFTMNGGEIKNNSSASSGGGVFVMEGTLDKKGGTIYGTGSEFQNTAGFGYAVDASYPSIGKYQYLNTTSGPNDILFIDGTTTVGNWE